MRGFQAASDGITIPFLVLFLWSKIIRKSGHQLQSPITICYWIFPRSSICYRQLEQSIYTWTVSSFKLRTFRIQALHAGLISSDSFQISALTCTLNLNNTILWSDILFFTVVYYRGFLPYATFGTWKRSH